MDFIAHMGFAFVEHKEQKWVTRAQRPQRRIAQVEATLRGRDTIQNSEDG